MLPKPRSERIPAISMTLPGNLGGEDYDLLPLVMDRWNGSIRASGENDDRIDILDAIGQGIFDEGITARSVAKQLDRMRAKQVTININSPGGSFLEGLAIYNMLREHPSPIVVNVLGLAGSIASVVAMAGDEIRIARAGFMMIHNTHGVVIGDKTAMLDMAEVMETFDKSIAGVYAARTGMKPDKIQVMMDKDTMFNAQQAIDDGFADDLLPSDAVKEETVTDRADAQNMSATRRLDGIMARVGMSRTERRGLLKEVRGKPGAVSTDGMPSAAVVRQVQDILASVSIPTFKG